MKLSNINNHRYRKFIISNPSQDKRKGKVIEMKDYFPDVFGLIRRREGVSTSAYTKAWTYLPQDIQIPETAAGRSGSLFLFSRDRRFLFKTIPKHEVDTLKVIIHSYAAHIKQNPDSRLMRFYGLYRFRVAKRKYIYIVVSNNIFYSPNNLRLGKKFDLKGRIIKTNTCFWSKSPPTAPAKGAIFKDNQLKRKFYPESGNELIKVLNNDAEWLKSQLCIDYSLLVGVHTVVTDTLKNQSKRLTELYDMAKYKKEKLNRERTYSVEDIILTASVPSYTIYKGDITENETTNSTIESQEEEEDIILDIEEEAVKEIYFIGIIDFLSRYLWKKESS